MNSINKYHVITDFYNELDEMFNIYSKQISIETIDKIEAVLELEVCHFIDAICYQEDVCLESKDIPIFSNFADCTINICLILETIDNVGVDMQKLGAILLEYDAKRSFGSG